jgi:hypothetical protein
MSVFNLAQKRSFPPLCNDSLVAVVDDRAAPRAWAGMGWLRLARAGLGWLESACMFIIIAGFLLKEDPFV